ncbi:MAG: type III-A CRISPR-associated RAMP protein Csm5 [Candidatus Cloacimonadales bacterium]|jgi:CRISPR-associated protein Csm5|nr:type III-A CRISPR-associated RAMP protein Csm5 [Candidatus Cloacimonadales bacterium]
MSVKNYEIKLKVLSPVHIGSGETLNPLRYVVKGNKLYFLNEMQYIKKLLNDPNSRLNQVVETNNIFIIANYFNDCFDEDDTDTWLYSYGVSDSFQMTFNNNLSNPDNQNQLLEFYRTDLFKTPVIPGSSLKGCFRTVLLSAMKKALSISTITRQTRGAYVPDPHGTEAKIVNMKYSLSGKPDIKTDPFKYFKVSDIDVDASSLTVKKIENMTAKRTSSLYYFSEMIDKGEQVYTGSLSIDSQFTKGLDSELGLNINNFIDFFIKSAKEYYRSVFENENVTLKSMGKTSSLKNIATQYARLNNTPNVAIFRLGKGQGCHSFSLEPKNLNPKSRNFADGESIGWVQIEFNER